MLSFIESLITKLCIGSINFLSIYLPYVYTLSTTWEKICFIHSWVTPSGCTAWLAAISTNTRTIIGDICGLFTFVFIGDAESKNVKALSLLLYIFIVFFGAPSTQTGYSIVVNALKNRFSRGNKNKYECKFAWPLSFK